MDALYLCTYIHLAGNAGTEGCADCTPDEFAAIIHELRDNSGLIGKHSHHLITYRNCFIGRELVTWLMKYKGFTSK